MNNFSHKDLEKEFSSYLDFWMQRMLSQKKQEIYPEMSQDLVPNKMADTGAMYLARILYGASRACLTMKDNKFSYLADTAFDLLSDLKNPSGGYYWARKNNMEWNHDAENVNMAQAFVLYGLAAYSRINSSPTILMLLEEQLSFIQVKLKDDSNEFYLDGFDDKWGRGEEMTRSFGTHFHVLEALVKVYEQNKTIALRKSIRGLTKLIIDRFIDKKNYSCLHRFSETGKLLPNEDWAGHNAEFSWVICEVAKSIDDAALIEITQNLAVKMMDLVIENAGDTKNGGYFNALDGKKPLENTKSWWPQAEVVLGLFNVFQITGNKKYKKLADEQVEFISDNFVTQDGEWYTEIENSGIPVKDMPVVFFWKSMYHTVRYYDYLLGKI